MRILCSRAGLMLWAVLGIMLPMAGQSQISPLLQITSLDAVPGHPTQFIFADSGTGSTNYQVEFANTLEGAPPTWIPLIEAAITPLGGGVFQVVLPDPGSETGFFRVRGLGGTVPTVTASFNATAFEVSEGGMVAPVINFSGPYFGTIRYTVSGTAESGDYQTLSGVVTVAGTSATIPITFEDNEMISQLRHLTLTLEAGPGIQLGSGSETIITLTENDAAWQGSFMAGSSLVGFVMTLRQSNGVYMASLKGELPGLFPASDMPVSLTFTADRFSAVSQGIPVAPESTLLGLPMNLTLLLDAANGETNQLVTPTQIEGTGLLISEVAAKPHLSTTTVGTFILLRPPAAPSTNEVDLVDVN